MNDHPSAHRILAFFAVNVVDENRDSFSELLERYHAGDPDAMAELFELYDAVIRVAVRRRMPVRLRKEFDSIDFAQDVWASFCTLAAEDCRFPTPEALEGFLAQVAFNKVIDAYRRRFADRSYGRSREEPFQSVYALEPSPSQWAIAGERWKSIAAELPAPHVAIVERLREGFSRKEVAEMAGVSLRSVTRIVERIQILCECDT